MVKQEKTGDGNRPLAKGEKVILALIQIYGVLMAIWLLSRPDDPAMKLFLQWVR